ncbi:MAG TPA: OmpH family outer membrane protein [Chitinophagaceae bacterium]
MKKGLLIWNIVLTLLVGFLLFSYFGIQKNGLSVGKTVHTDTTTAPNRDFRIAYFDMDSVEANFEMVKDKKAELSKKEDLINVELDRMGKNFQQKYNYYQGQAQSGAMTQAQQEAAGQELKSLEDKIKNSKASMEQDYQDLVLRVNKEMKSAIENYLLEYNRTKGYSYIFANESGLFYYRDTTYNITNDVVKGLNISYRKKLK